MHEQIYACAIRLVFILLFDQVHIFKFVLQYQIYDETFLKLIIFF